MPTEAQEDFDLVKWLRSAPPREREEWRVKVEYGGGITRYWTGADWATNPRMAAHFFDMHMAVKVVYFLQHTIPVDMAHVQAEPVKEN